MPLGPNQRRLFMCDYCDKMLDSQKKITDHIWEVHPHDEEYKCIQCLKLMHHLLVLASMPKLSTHLLKNMINVPRSLLLIVR